MFHHENMQTTHPLLFGYGLMGFTVLQDRKEQSKLCMENIMFYLHALAINPSNVQHHLYRNTASSMSPY